MKSDEGKWDAYMSNLSIPAPKLALYINYGRSQRVIFNLQYVRTGKRDRFSTNEKGNYNEGEGIVERGSTWLI